jgi:hypothetical protein
MMAGGFWRRGKTKQQRLVGVAPICLACMNHHQTRIQVIIGWRDMIAPDWYGC